jgi:hypothetical protein
MAYLAASKPISKVLAETQLESPRMTLALVKRMVEIGKDAECASDDTLLQLFMDVYDAERAGQN